MLIQWADAVQCAGAGPRDLDRILEISQVCESGKWRHGIG